MMQMMYQHTGLIKKLRSLSRIGQTNGPFDEESRRTTSQATNDLDQILNVNRQLREVGELFKQLNTDSQNLQHGLSLLATVQETYNASLITTIKNATLFDQIEAKIAKSLSISTEKSYELSETYGTYIDRLKTSRTELDKYRSTLNKILPLQSKNIIANDKYAERLLNTQQILQDYQGLTEDQAAAYTLYTEGADKNIVSQLTATKELANTWEQTTGQIGAFNAILTGVSSLTADIRSEYSRIPGNLDVAVLKSRALGMSMADLDKIGTNLLNIEESVGKEIEFQLISGRRLTDANGRSLTMRFREAKVMGNGIKMAEAMTDVIETQGNLIENGTFLQKQALADALGTSVQELVLAKQKYELNKKVAEFAQKANPDQQFNKLTAKQQATVQIEYEKALQKSGDTEQLNAIKELKKKEFDLKTPADRSATLLQSIVDNGIYMRMPKTVTTGKGTAEEKRVPGYSRFDSETFAATVGKTSIANLTAQQNESIMKTIGQIQSYNSVLSTQKRAVQDLIELLPGVKKVVDILIDAARKLPVIGTVIGAIMEAGNALLEPTRIKGKAVNVGVTETKHDDALVMNDGVIRFHPSDKFMRVNDSTMIAGTSVDGNKKLARSISGGGMDMNKMVAAIQTAFAGVQISVNVDPMKIDREIKFRTATINSKQGRV